MFIISDCLEGRRTRLRKKQQNKNRVEYQKTLQKKAQSLLKEYDELESGEAVELEYEQCQNSSCSDSSWLEEYQRLQCIINDASDNLYIDIQQGDCWYKASICKK